MTEISAFQVKLPVMEKIQIEDKTLERCIFTLK